MVNAFELDNVTKTFPGFKLGPLNLVLQPGVVLGFIGPNGAGKTTTMQCLVGLLKADSGRMQVFGRPTDPNRVQWKQDIGYVGDVHVFYENWSGAKNLRFRSQFYPGWSESLADELARRFDIPLEKKAKNLSSGNRVKLSLIAALAHSPRLLLLDEPTAGLDPVVRNEVLDVLFSILEDGERSIFYSTHILSDISRLADELAFIVNGQITQTSAKDDLLEQWRKITFKFEGTPVLSVPVFSIRSEGTMHQIITSEGTAALMELQRLGAKSIEQIRMPIDEIAVQILKREHHE